MTTDKSGIEKYNILGNPFIVEDMEAINKSLFCADTLRNSKILITGANGMIASYMVCFFLYLNKYHGYNIQLYLLVRNKEKLGKRFGIGIDNDAVHVIVQDVLQPVSLSTDFDYIIHAASLASPQFYGTNPVETMLPNIIGTYNLLEYVKAHKPKAFLFFSSGSVYGNISISQPISEADVGTLHYLENGSMYALSKQQGEALCRAYYVEYGINTKCVRIAHSYGPTMDYENDKRVFAEFARNIINKEDIVLKSSGSDKRPFCYMSDVIAGLITVMLLGNPGESYNLANDEQFVSISELANKLTLEFSERGISVVYTRRVDFGYSASGDVHNQSFDTTKIRALGWKPAVSIEKGFRRTVEAIEYSLRYT